MGVLSIDYRKSLGSYGVYRHFQQYFCYIDIRGCEFEDIKVVIRIEIDLIVQHYLLINKRGLNLILENNVLWDNVSSITTSSQ
jgi:hypothetical protein